MESDVTVCISLSTKSLCEGMKPTIPFSAMGKYYRRF